MHGQYFVYIVASESRELYIGVTNDMRRRISEHRRGLHPDSYAYEHRTFSLVCLESCYDVRDAIRREKQLKRWIMQKKVELVESRNPDWRDLAEGIT